MAVARERAARPREPRSGTPSPRAAGVPGASSLFGRQHARSPLCPAEQGTATPRGRTAGPRGSAGPGEYGTCQPGAGGSVPERSQGRGRPPPRPPQRRAQGQRTGSRSRGASCSPPRPLLGSGQDPLVLSDLPQMRPPCGPVQPVRPGTLCPGGSGPWGHTPDCTQGRGGAGPSPLRPPRHSALPGPPLALSLQKLPAALPSRPLCPRLGPGSPGWKATLGRIDAATLSQRVTVAASHGATINRAVGGGSHRASPRPPARCPQVGCGGNRPPPS